MNINPVIFREYDIRGTVGVDLTEDLAYVLGKAYAGLAAEHGKNNIAVGFDCRLSSEGFGRAIAQGMADGGIDVQITGMGPTPQLYFSIAVRNLGGGIQVTGSHNPPDMNGFKVCLGTAALSGREIQDIKERVIKVVRQEGAARQKSPHAKTRGTIKDAPIRDEYIRTLIDNAKPHMGRRRLKVVVDAGNGVGGLVGPAVLRGLGVEVVELFCEPDGRFPNHHPDPTVMKNIKDLIDTVKAAKADVGIGWDGDADRIGVVDEKGQVIFGDLLLLLYGRALLEEVPGATIIGDVKCSSRLFEDLRARGAKMLMWKTGHSLIKSKLREIGAELGGEMSGHIVFKHRFYGFDDAIYSTVRFVEILSKTDKRASQLLSDLPAMVATPEIRLDCTEDIKFKISEKAKEAFSEFKVDTIDGVRITFEHGWGLVRASNTQPVLVLRFEAVDEKYLESYKKLVTDRLERIKEELGG